MAARALRFLISILALVGLGAAPGHGRERTGKNYVRPRDGGSSTAPTGMVQTVDADTAINQTSMAQSRVNLVILDACRNSPFERRFRSQAGGLASIDAPTGTL